MDREELQKKFADADFEKTIVGYINNRLLQSEFSMGQNYTQWDKNRKLYDADVIRPTEEINRNKTHGDVPQYETLRIPYIYAAVQTYLTYLLALYTKRKPMFQLEGKTDKHAEAASMMQTILHNNAINRGYIIPIHTWLRDGMIFNRGIIWRDWYKVTKKVRTTVPPMSVLGVPVGNAIEKMTDMVEDEGNDLFTSSPYDTYFDPSVTMQNHQKGEFVARAYFQSWVTVLEKMQERFYWDKRSKIPNNPTMQWRNRTAPNRPGEQASIQNGAIENNQHTAVEITDIIIRLIPKDWQLGEGSFPEYWRFIVANGKTILYASPERDLYEFPCYVIEPEFDGRTLNTKDLTSMMAPLQELLSWLINSHMDSVRKTINNKFIIDPSMVVWKDVEENKPYVRLSQKAYGKNAGAAIYQLKMYDATQTHLNDIGLVIDLLTRISAATENFMGITSGGGDRKTATEVRTANTLAGSRIEKVALIIGHQGWMPMTRGLVNGVQANLSETFNYQDYQGGGYQKISPEQIKNGLFNYTPVDPTIPVDKLQLAQTWAEVMQALSSNQGLMQQYDMKRIFEHWASLGGAGELANFRVQVASPVSGQNNPEQQGASNGQQTLPFGNAGGNTVQPQP